MLISFFRKGSMRLGWSLPVLTAVCLYLSSVAPVCAQDVKNLFKQLNKEQRQAQKDMFAGKSDQAIARLEKLRDLLAEIKKADPNNPKLKTATNKYNKLVKDLERKTGQNLGSGSVTVAKSKALKLPPKPEAKPLAQKKPVAPAPKKVTKKTPAPSSKSPAPVATVGKLPSGVTSRIKKINKSLEKVTKNLDRNSVQRAEFEFRNVDKVYQEIQDRYGDQAPADHPEMIALSKRIAAVENRLKQSAGEAAAAEAAAQKSKAEKAALNNEWVGKMAPFISRGSDKHLEDMIWKLKGEEAARNRRNYEAAIALLQEYEAVEFPLGKSMDLQNSEHSLRSVLKNLQEAYAKQETEKGSEGWVQKLAPFVTSGQAKRLSASYTSDVTAIQRQKQIYAEASKLFEQYRRVEFPQGKSPKLKQIEEELADALAKFPAILQRSVEAQIGRAEAKLDQEIAFLKSEQEWKSDTAKKPYTLSKDRIKAARKLIDRAAELLPADDPGLVRLNEKMAGLIKMNTERHKVRAARTRMLPDKFEGDGEKAVKERAVKLVRAKFTGIKILRSTVISEDWKEETVKEWTDTTKTALRVRTTRSVTAQVAGKKTDGEVRLYTLYIAKNRRSDGTWGKLYGNLHSDLGDLMLEDNVNK